MQTLSLLLAVSCVGVAPNSSAATAAGPLPAHQVEPHRVGGSSGGGGRLAPKPNGTLVKLLTEIADWTMTTGVGDNMLRNRSIFDCNDSIFVNGADPSCQQRCHLRMRTM